jgi:hypothetical protein
MLRQLAGRRMKINDFVSRHNRCDEATRFPTNERIGCGNVPIISGIAYLSTLSFTAVAINVRELIVEQRASELDRNAFWDKLPRIGRQASESPILLAKITINFWEST